MAQKGAYDVSSQQIMQLVIVTFTIRRCALIETEITHLLCIHEPRIKVYEEHL